MKSLIKFICFFVVLFCLSSCEKHDEDLYGSGSRRNIQISADVKNKIYTNDRNIKLDASNTNQINVQRKLSYSWTCKVFPNGQPPKINNATNSIATIDSLMLGNYNFQLTVKDDFGNQAIANYALEVLKDALPKDYEGTWVYMQDEWDGYSALKITDPNNFAGRTPANTKITVFNVETQAILDHTHYTWNIDDLELNIYTYNFKMIGGKAIVTVSY